MSVNGRLGLKSWSLIAKGPSKLNSMADNTSPGPNRSEDAEKKVKGATAGGLDVGVPDASDTKAQDRALQNYKITGVVGDYVDPTRDQEWDIAPEFGVAPHPELHNVSPNPDHAGKPGMGLPAPTQAGYGGNPTAATKALPVEEKAKRAEELDKETGDAPVSERLAAGRPDLRGNANASTAVGPPQQVEVVRDRTKEEADSKKAKDKS